MHQGGSRRAPRRRRPLSARRAGAHRAGWLAPHGVSHPRRRSLLRRHLFPSRGQSVRAPRLHIGPEAGSRHLPAATGQSRRERRGDPPARHRIARRGATRRGRRRPAGAGGGPDGAGVRHPLRRLRHGAQVPASGRGAIPARPLARRGRRLDARRGGEDAHRDGARRHSRPRGWRLPPLLGGRALDRASLREDGIRQRRTAARLPGRVRRPRHAALQAGGTGDSRLGARGALGR